MSVLDVFRPLADALKKHKKPFGSNCEDDIFFEGLQNLVIYLMDIACLDLTISTNLSNFKVLVSMIKSKLTIKTKLGTEVAVYCFRV